MEKIASFKIDHTKLLPGLYVSRIDEVGDTFVTTFDVRMTRPNTEPAVQANAMHTIEHIMATYLRNDAEWKDRIVYWGPMGCMTGSYLIVKGKVTPQEVKPLLTRAFEYLSEYDGPIPGASAVECGNYLFQDLPMARWYAKKYLKALAISTNI